MRIPQKPPPWNKIFTKAALERLFKTDPAIVPGEGKEYFHWDELRRRPAPAGLSYEDWWLALKLNRKHQLKDIPLRDKAGLPFRFLVPQSVYPKLHEIDLGIGGNIGVPEPVINPDTQRQYCVSSLIEEAITSSQLEGASATRQVAKEMIRTGRPARDRSERMILNNYATMKRIVEVKTIPLSRELVFELHRLVTEDTWDGDDASGRFRRPDEEVVVSDIEGQDFHVPPFAGELEERMALMCDFANGKTPDFFIHPVIRAIILHFWLAYDHPFRDGNGRTARSLFYWAMLHYGYWLAEYISISHILVKAPAQYSRSFLYTETDDNDLTYFIAHQIFVLDQAHRQLERYIEEQVEKRRVLERSLVNLIAFNPRQQAILSHALRHPGWIYTIDTHKLIHGVSYQTARTDLLGLAGQGLFISQKQGKAWQFRAVPDIEARLKNIR